MASDPEPRERVDEEVMSATTPRLILVGEYNLFRECLASMLADFERFAVVGQASTLGEVAGGEELAAELVLVDVGGSAEEMLEEIKSFTADAPDAKLVALGLEESERAILPFIEAGASAYVLKEASVSELAQVLDRVLRGEAVCSPQIASKMFSRLADLSRARRREERLEALALTPRELEILQLVADGYSNKEIAGRLYLSFHTVKNHVHNILEKLKVQDRGQAVDHAVRMRWLKKNRRRRSGEPHGL